MADNYLERKFEEMQMKKISRKTSAAIGKQKTFSEMTRKKIVFVTGGAKGIGKAIVSAFDPGHYRVAFCDIDEISGNKTAKETGAVFYKVDIRKQEELESCMSKIFEAWGDIDILINNAGVSIFTPLTDISVDDFDSILSTNLRPVFITSRFLAIHRKKLLVPNLYGRIINICSTRYLMSEPGSEAYAASKGGIYSLTHALALSLADLHITVNSISPGWIQNLDYESLRPIDHVQHPSKRVGKPEDIARICVFLSQPENDFINAENITVDGGMTKKMIYEE